jgi:hypothetical protein
MHLFFFVFDALAKSALTFGNGKYFKAMYYLDARLTLQSNINEFSGMEILIKINTSLFARESMMKFLNFDASKQFDKNFHLTDKLKCFFHDNITSKDKKEARQEPRQVEYVSGAIQQGRYMVLAV